jgi:uncharacterized membrane protein
MAWLFFALSGPVLWAISTHLDKFLVEKYFKTSSPAVLLVFTALAGLLLLPFIWLGDPRVLELDFKSISLMALSGVLYMGAMLFYLLALQLDEASVVVPFFQISPLFSYGLGYLILGEVLSATQVAGCLLIIGGTILVSRQAGPGGRRFKTRLMGLMLACGFALACSVLIFKLFALRNEFWTTTFWMYVGEAAFGAALMAFGPYRRQFIATLRSNTAALMAITGVNELINIGGGLGTRFALLLAPLSIVQAVGSTTTLFVFAIGALLSLLFPTMARESLSGSDLTQKGIAAIVVSVGVMLVSR